MAAAAGGSTASFSAAGSHSAKIPANELGSSLGSAFQKKVCVYVCMHVCIFVYAYYCGLTSST